MTVPMPSEIAAIDLFCGAGGLTHGFEQAGISVLAGYDIDPDCAFPYTQNNQSSFVLKSIDNIEKDEIDQFFSNHSTKVRVIAGCAPCQPFSTYSQRYPDKGGQWKLLRNFTQLIKECQPEIVSMENVIHLKSHQVFGEFCYALSSLGYHVDIQQVNCLSYGIPQSRKRLVILASKIGDIRLTEPTHSPNRYKTVQDTIAHLEPLQAGQASVADRLHQCSHLSPLNLERIRLSTPGGTWRDWPEDLRAKCHIKESGKTYPGVYGRMKWDQPSPTITTQFFGFGNGRFGHPEQNRAISIREGALLQTFPEHYEFLHPSQKLSFSRLGKLIGNAVPIELGRIIAKSIMDHVKLNG
mgnify:CR=1 FL=1